MSFPLLYSPRAVKGLGGRLGELQTRGVECKTRTGLKK